MVRPVVKNAGGQGFPDSSAGKESACNAGDPGLIPGWGRSTGEGIGYPLQYSGLEHSMDYSPWGRKESDTTFTCCWMVLLPQAPQESPSPLLPRLLPASPSDLSTVQGLHSPCSRDGSPWLWQAPFRDWHQGDKREHARRGGRQRRVGSRGQRALRAVSCVCGFISPLCYYLKDKMVLGNSRASIFPLCSHYLENSESEHGNTLPVPWRPWRREDQHLERARD